MAATGIKLTNGAAHKTVATEAQAIQLESLGWTRESEDTASDTTAYTELPYFYQMSDKINPTHRGAGIGGVAAGTLGYVMRKSSVGMTTAQLTAMLNAFGDKESSAETTYTAISVVTALPTGGSISATTIYILTVADTVASKAAGNYVHPSSTWDAYTAA